MNKTFDCVEMKREGARQLQAKLDAMTEAEQAEYWARRSCEFEQEVREARAARAAAGLPEFEPDTGGLEPEAAPQKPFDCVEMKRQGALRVQAMLSTMTEEEQTKWWAERGRELRERQAQLIQEKAAAERATQP